MVVKHTISPKSFRVSNSVVQGVTTATGTNLHRLTAFQTIALFGLLAHVDSKEPSREVELTLGDILEIIQVGKTVETTVERSWVNQGDETKSRRYRSHRISPAHYQRLHDALKALHNQKVSIKRTVDGRMKIAFVHLLDSFGYYYNRDGSKLDVYQLPGDLERFNDGSDERPLWRVRSLDPEYRSLLPSSVFFKLHPLLADELLKHEGTIGSTVFARKIFDTFQRYSKKPAAIRLIILILRQTSENFKRHLKSALDELGFDISHTTRAVASLREALENLAQQHIIRSHAINVEANSLEVECNRQWYMEGGE